MVENNLVLLALIQITDTCFGLIGSHQSDTEISIDRKILNVMGESNPQVRGRYSTITLTNSLPTSVQNNNDYLEN